MELTGDVSGIGTYNSTTNKVSITTSGDSFDLGNLEKINLESMGVTLRADTLTRIDIDGHGLLVGSKIRLFGTSYDGEYTIQQVTSINQFTINLDTNGQADEFGGYIIPNQAQLLYNSVDDEFQIALENFQLNHSEISGLTNDDHTQYNNINGRGTGSSNPVVGASVAGGHLFLRSTSDASKGVIFTDSNITPLNSPAYSGGWTGLDLGDSSRPFRDIHSVGYAKGLRLEAVTSLPVVSTQEIGRLVQMPSGAMYINADGVSYKELIYKPNLVGQAGKAMVVNAGETGLELGTVTNSSTKEVVLNSATDIPMLLTIDSANTYCIVVTYVADRGASIEYGKFLFIHDGTTASVQKLDQSGSIGMTFGLTQTTTTATLEYSTTNSVEGTIRYTFTELDI